MRTAAAILEIREILSEHETNMAVIAKIENAEGIENLDAIIEASDGIMVARGDMGVEIPAQEVPYIQKMIDPKMQRSLQTGYHCDSDAGFHDPQSRARREPRLPTWPTPVYDGTDAVMLSGETAMGKYPMEALSMMASIVEETEKHLDYSAYRKRRCIRCQCA